MKFLFLFLLVGCQHQVGYMDDSAFMAPSAGNSPEVLMTVNGKPCLDTDGNPGLCGVRVKAGTDLTVHLSGEPYAYQLDLVCSEALGFNGQVPCPSGQPLDVTVPAGDFSSLKSFTCIGTVLPQDRPEAVSESFEFRVTVVAAGYSAREDVRVLQEDGEWYVYPGPYALHTFIEDQGVWEYTSEMRVKASGRDVTVTSESRSGRRNIYRGD